MMKIEIERMLTIFLYQGDSLNINGRIYHISCLHWRVKVLGGMQ